MPFYFDFFVCECFMFYDDLYFNVDAISLTPVYEFHAIIV